MGWVLLLEGGHQLQQPMPGRRAPVGSLPGGDQYVVLIHAVLALLCLAAEKQTTWRVTMVKPTLSVTARRAQTVYVNVFVITIVSVAAVRDMPKSRGEKTNK